MGLPNFFKLPKHKVFSYSPLYYDPEKEELENKRKKENIASSEKKINPENIRGQFRSSYFRNVQKRKQQSNIRLIVLILFLFFVVYYIFLRK